ncbi:hypothetical protein [Verrucomicrobium spinosum]|uniref:hypothetical protein n=1 Tax=Verrucomicrobium spinosum TaxID=2736 RepID=UPI0012E2F0EC|nr:hypothetical protein [Verrucomicrobium spinosum]
MTKRSRMVCPCSSGAWLSCVYVLPAGAANWCSNRGVSAWISSAVFPWYVAAQAPPGSGASSPAWCPRRGGLEVQA